jgi:uncharacterized membrane protein
MRGSIAITAALWLTIAVASLCVLDVSHVWWQRRTLQGVVDMAAMAGAQRLDDSCGTGAQTLIKQNALANGYSGALTVTCGRYNLNTKSLVANSVPYNAVNVALNDDVAYWFIPSFSAQKVSKATVAVQATSRVINVGAFTLGTGLATVQSGNSALLNGLLTGLLGSSSALNLSLLTYQTLASTQIKLGDLAVALGARDVTDLLTKPAPTMSALVTALGTVAAKTSGAASTVLNALSPPPSSTIGSRTINLNGSNSTPGLFNIGLSNKNGALNATVNVLDALLVAAEVANSGPSATPITINLISLVAPAQLSSLLSGTLSIKVNQPPALAIGEAGRDSLNNWRTTAQSAQISLLLDLSVNVSLLGIGAHIPLYIGVAPGTAVLTATQCGAGNSDSGSFMTVQPGLASLCLAGPAPAMFATASNATLPKCEGGGAIVNVTPLVTLSGVADVELKPVSKSIAFTGAGHMIAAPNPVTVTSNDLGQDLTSALASLTSSLLQSFQLSIAGVQITLGPVLALVVQPILDLITSLVTLTLGPLLTSLVPPLLNLLGAQVGTSTVTDLSLTCGNVQLVN